MDRSRLVTALALVFSLVAVVLGITQIGVSGREGPFVSETESFLTTGRAGIALIELHGPIAEDSYPGADRIVEQLDAARQSAAVRAVLLSVNSPGGAVGATKKIYDKVLEVRQSKPVIAVVSDIAASGGYYVASAADQIFAYDGTLIGSIGVISLRPNVGDFLKRYGVSMEAMKAGRYKDMSYPFRDLTEEERGMYQKFLDAAYNQFIHDVARGRKKSEDDVRNWAEGRIFSGAEARARQMIDNSGGREEAVAAIKIMLKTNQDLPLLRAPRTFIEQLMESQTLRYFSGGVAHSERRLARSLYDAPVLYLYPGSAGFVLDLMETLHR